MESYVRGLQADSGEQKMRYFTRAARLDENFSQPNFQLGLLYWSKKEQRGAAEWFARVKPASPQFHHASFLLGLCRYYLADHAGAEAAFRLVAEASGR